MLLELSKAISLFASILALYPAAASAFFTQGMHWQERFELLLPKLVIAACFCFASGLLFAWPVEHRAPVRLHSTLPIRIFLWSLLVIGLLFTVSWYVSCGNPMRMSYNPTCG